MKTWPELKSAPTTAKTDPADRVEALVAARSRHRQIARIVFHRPARMLDLPLSDRETIDRRGFGVGLSMAIEAFNISPRPLEAYLNRFFAKPALSAV